MKIYLEPTLARRARNLAARDGLATPTAWVRQRILLEPFLEGEEPPR